MDQNRKGRPIIGIIGLVLAIVLLLSPLGYILSAGPAIWMVHHGYLDVMTYFAVFRPLIAFAYDHETFNNAMNWYLSWWGGPVSL